MKKILFLCAILSIAGIICFINRHQDTNPANEKKERTVSKIASDFHTNKARAQEIYNALNYNSELYLQTIKDRSIPTNEKKKRLDTLEALRQARIQSLLTFSEKMRLAGLVEKQRAKRLAKIEQESRTPRPGVITRPHIPESVR